MDKTLKAKMFPGRWLLLGLIGICTVVEAVQQLASMLGGSAAQVSDRIFEGGAFWPGLLQGAQPLYSGQPWLMFVTYGFLHAGLLHLGLNMLTLWSLGRPVLQRVGTWGFMEIYGSALLGGGLGYGLLANGDMPMVGASGALFGLAGAILTWATMDRSTRGLSLVPIARAAGFLVLINLVLWWAMSGLLAWQTHLGGFIVGAMVALIQRPAMRRPV